MEMYNIFLWFEPSKFHYFRTKQRDINILSKEKIGEIPSQRIVKNVENKLLANVEKESTWNILPFYVEALFCRWLFLYREVGKIFDIKFCGR